MKKEVLHTIIMTVGTPAVIILFHFGTPVCQILSSGRFPTLTELVAPLAIGIGKAGEALLAVALVYIGKNKFMGSSSGAAEQK
jgi:hypothetical protein